MVTLKTMPVDAAAASRPLAPAIVISGGEIWLVIETTLLVGLRSWTVLATMKVFVIVPGKFACTMTLAVALDPAGSNPMPQLTVPAKFEIAPWLLVAETKATFVGNKPCMRTAAAAPGPRLVTDKLNASCIPVRRGGVPRI